MNVIQRQIARVAARRTYAPIYPSNPPALKRRGVATIAKDPFAFEGPLNVCYDALLALHDSCGVPWWGSIALTTVALRGVITLPLAVSQQRRIARLEHVTELLGAWRATLARTSESAASSAKLLSDKRRELLRTYRCRPAGALLLPLAQIPLFVLMSATLRRLVAFPVPFLETAPFAYPGLDVGGAAWFDNLAVADPTGTLPLAMGTASALALHLNTGDAPAMKRRGVGRYLVRAGQIALGASTVLAMYVPAALSLFWATSALISLAQAIVFRAIRDRRRSSRALPIRQAPSAES